MDVRRQSPVPVILLLIIIALLAGYLASYYSLVKRETFWVGFRNGFEYPPDYMAGDSIA